MAGIVNAPFTDNSQNNYQQQQLGLLRAQMLMQSMQPQQNQQNSQPQSAAGADISGASNMINQFLKAQYMNQMAGTGNGLKQNVAYGLNGLGAGNISYDMLNNPKYSPGVFDGSQ